MKLALAAAVAAAAAAAAVAGVFSNATANGALPSYVWVASKDHAKWIPQAKVHAVDGRDRVVLVSRKTLESAGVRSLVPVIRPLTKFSSAPSLPFSMHTSQVVVRVAPTTTARKVLEYLKLPSSVSVSKPHRHRFVVRFPTDLSQFVVETFVNRTDVLWVHPRPRFELHTSFVTEDVFGNPDYLLEDETGVNATLFIADTGLDFNHCMFSSSSSPPLGTLTNDTPVFLANNPATKVRAYLSLCLNGQCTDFADTYGGHGTHVSGIAIGQTCALKYGVAQLARVVFMDMAYGSNGLELPASLEAMFASAQGMGATASSFSWGGSTNDGSYGDLDSEFDDILYANPTWVAAVAAGNAGMTGGSGSDPATAKNVLSVGAVLLGSDAYSDGQHGYDPTLVSENPTYYATNQAAQFSSLGPWADGRVGPLVCAPGVYVLSAEAGTTQSFVLMTGTSMATPAVPTLAVQARLQQFLATLPPSSMVRAAIIATATPVLGVFGVSANAPAAAKARCAFGAVDVSTLMTSENWYVAAATVQTPTVETLCFAPAAGVATVTVALAWNEPGAAPGSSATVLNHVLIQIGGTACAASQADISRTPDNHQRVSC